jgi:hypothetical protein
VILADGAVLPNPLLPPATRQVITAPPLPPTLRESEHALIVSGSKPWGG